MELAKRKSPRLKGYDYSQNGAYFITICTHGRSCLLSDIVGAIHESPLQSRSIIDKLVGYLKMNVSKRAHSTYKGKIWQRSYYDHIIRGEKDYLEIWQYIDTNAAKWQEDSFYNYNGVQ